VDFRNTVIIMTSNIGARLITAQKSTKLGFASEAETAQARTYEKIKSDVLGELKNHFRPEFLNRIDDTIVFHPLDEAQIQEIAKLMLKSLTERLAKNEITAEFTEAVVEMVSKAGFDPIYGARPLRRAIQTKIEDALAEKMLDADIGAGDSIVVDYKDEALAVEKK